MARRHFTQEGLPKLDTIISELLEFCGNVSQRYAPLGLNKVAIIGGQAQEHPKYLLGNHDLDLYLETTPSLMSDQMKWGYVKHLLFERMNEDPERKPEAKQFYLDFHFAKEDEGPRDPHVVIYESRSGQ